MVRSLFISYSRADSDHVATLAEDLEGFDHSPWMDDELTGGMDWWSEVLRRIRECDLFVFAVSHASVTSEACLREYEYAVALGKPVLPVTVRQGASDALLPAALGHIQRVDYSTPDRSSLIRLIKAINAVPVPEPLPDPPPPEPPIPATYLYDLSREIGSSEPMSPAKQDEILGQLRHQAEESESAEAVRHMIQRMRRRDDLLVRISSQLDAIESNLPASSGVAATLPAAETSRPAVAPTPPAVVSPPPPVASTPGPTGTEQGSKPVNPLWWAAPIVFAFVGGFVAWLVLKNQNEKTARNMLITGLAMSFVYFVCNEALLL